MARGWESKSVEAQQADASAQSSKPGVKLSPEQAVRQREKERLRLSRQSILQQLANARHSRHREMLQDALADLDQRLNSL